MQAKAEELFERGNYRRAHFIYRHELAPIGDKYAQYMLGYMAQSGLGVNKDPVVASAWYRLAAERKSPEFVAVRDELMSQFDYIDIERSDAAYIGLRKVYSDIILRMRVVRDGFETLAEITTGSRLGRSVAPVTIVRPGSGSSVSSGAYVQQIERQMERQLNYITNELGIEPVDAELSERELNRLEALVAEHVNQVDDRE